MIHKKGANQKTKVATAINTVTSHLQFRSDGASIRVSMYVPTNVAH